jgi:hypothetical protein
MQSQSLGFLRGYLFKAAWLTQTENYHPRRQKPGELSRIRLERILEREVDPIAKQHSVEKNKLADRYRKIGQTNKLPFWLIRKAQDRELKLRREAVLAYDYRSHPGMQSAADPKAYLDEADRRMDAAAGRVPR